ncbi:MAG TPA: hypothetical protein VH475_28635 [Tepidisphaeraceae bacterium]|jgi:hypothetical protein
MMRSRDPLRSLELAVLFARVQGGMHLLLAFLAVLALMDPYDGKHAFVGFILFGAIILPFVVVPAALYLLYAISMARRKRWAVITVLVFACVHGAITICWPLLILADGGAVPPFGLVLTAALLVVASLLILYCVRALPAVRPPTVEPSGPRGFDVVTPGGQARSFPTPPRSLKQGPRGSE